MNTLNAHDMNQDKAERLARIKSEAREKINNEIEEGELKNDSFDDTESTWDDPDCVFEPDSNVPVVDFLKFINNHDAYLMLENKKFPLEDSLRKEGLGYPLGVTFDEELKEWIISDQNNHKILCISMEKEQIKVTETPQLRNPSAMTMYKQGKSVAVLCSEDKRSKFSIFIYNLEKQFLSSFASYSDPIYQMEGQFRGIAKSYDRNILSLDLGQRGNRKKLRVFKKNEGSQGFEMLGAVNPSFLATIDKKVAVSDLGVNKVFIFNLNDMDWKDVKFAPLHVISTTPGMALSELANTSGFRFVSGLQFDKNGFLLIGDAEGGTIKLFDTEGEFLHRVSSDFAMPYMSGFHINQNGEVMMLDLRSVRKLHWAQMKPVNSILPWQEGGGVRRAPNDRFNRYRNSKI